MKQKRRTTILSKISDLGNVFSSSLTGSLLLILFVALIVRIITLREIDFNGHDENAYLIFINAFAEKGIEGIRSIIRLYPNHDFLSQGPLPLRILYVVVGFTGCKLLGAMTLNNLAWVSFFFGMGTILVGFLLLRKWFQPLTAFLTTFLLITSPLAIGLSQRALQDTFFAFLVVSSIYFYHQCWNSRNIWNPILFGLTLVACFLTKESTLFLYPCFVLAGFYYTFYYKPPLKFKKFPYHILIPFLMAPLISFCILLWVVGDFSTFVKIYQFYSEMQHIIPYTLKYQKGPWFRYLIDFMLLSPLTYVLAIIGAVTPLANKANLNGRNLALLYALSGLIFLTFLPILNVRFVFFLDLFLRALAATGILNLAEKIKNNQLYFNTLVLVIILVLGLDLHQYYRIYYLWGTYDPVTSALIQANGFIR